MERGKQGGAQNLTCSSYVYTMHSLLPLGLGNARIFIIYPFWCVNQILPHERVENRRTRTSI